MTLSGDIFLVVEQIQFVLPDVLQSQLFRAGAIVLCKLNGVMGVTSLCGGCEATQLHVLDKSLSERVSYQMAPFQIGISVTEITVLQFGRRPRARHQWPCYNLPLRCCFAADTASAVG